MTRAALVLLSVFLVASQGQTAPPAVMHYLDEAGNRHATVTTGDFGKVTLVFRFIGGAGSSSSWIGDGTRKDKEITFAQTVGEDQERGTFFIAKGGESKIEVEFKPGQRTPQDAGINGTYRHITDEKRLSLAKKEAALAEDALSQLFRTAPRSWPSEDKPVAAAWKSRWPDLRTRWMGLVFKPAAAPAPIAPKPGSSPAAKSGDAGTQVESADYWTALSETTGLALGFIGQPLDKLIPPGWDGEYNDGFGGHVSLRLGSDGILRFTLSCTRGIGEGHTGELIGRIPATSLKTEKNGGFTASYKHADAELKPDDQPATVTLRKTGHFLFVETQYTQRYCGRAWFDGIYRWGPVPTE